MRLAHVIAPALAAAPALTLLLAPSASAPPSARHLHTAVWTGREMIVWGGMGPDGSGRIVPLDTGGRYDPAADTWLPTPLAGAPSPRVHHTATWTGREMIVWGGSGPDALNSGARYDPATDSWTPMTVRRAPSARAHHTATWTGQEVIVFGGSAGEEANTVMTRGGKRYDPARDRWRRLSNRGAPSPRRLHSASSSGIDIFVWGGEVIDRAATEYLADGARYDWRKNKWRPMSGADAPSARSRHGAIWTGNRVIVWGGQGPRAAVGRGSDGAEAVGELTSGGVYDIFNDDWAPTSQRGAPSRRLGNTAVWAGTANGVLIWGGQLNGNPVKSARILDWLRDRWFAMPIGGAPRGRSGHTAVWNGAEMIVWGGEDPGSGRLFDDGGRYNAPVKRWTRF